MLDLVYDNFMDDLVYDNFMNDLVYDNFMNVNFWIMMSWSYNFLELG